MAQQWCPSEVYVIDIGCEINTRITLHYIPGSLRAWHNNTSTLYMDTLWWLPQGDEYAVVEEELGVARCPYDPSHNSTAIYIGKCVLQSV